MPDAAQAAPAQKQVSPAIFEHILNVARRLASSSDLQEVLGLIIDTLRDSLHADRAGVFQYDPGTHELIATRVHGLPPTLRLPADKGIIGEAARTKKIVNIPDAYADSRFNQAVDKATGYRTRCLLTIPMLDFEDQLVGVAQLLNKGTNVGGVFTHEDETIAGHLADQAAVALKRASLLEARRVKEKLEADLDVARKIQMAALPDKMPKIAGYDVAGHFQPADQTAGDAYDVIDLRSMPARESGEDALLFMADATGHGIGPALSVAQVLAMVRMGCRVGASLADIAVHANEQLVCDLPAGRFVTAFLGALDSRKHTLSVVSAGQAPLLFVKGDHVGGYVCGNANAMPLGIDPDFRFEPVDPFRFDPGDMFLLLSDGYYEAMDVKGEQLGVQRVVETVQSHSGESAERVIKAIREMLTRFVAGRPAADDQTAVVIKRTA